VVPAMPVAEEYGRKPIIKGGKGLEVFTGLIEGRGTVLRLEKKGAGLRPWIKAEFSWPDPRLGESIAVNGVCLTATSWKDGVFSVDVSGESLSRSTLGRLKAGAVVNLERALRLSDRLGGHWVTGHVDGVGEISRREIQGKFLWLRIGFPEHLGPYIVEKGSIAVEGVSLTVNRVSGLTFELTIIPHTADQTTLPEKRAGEAVNLETDLIGKYVVHFLNRTRSEGARPESKITADFLAEHGFL
jgi:riboflavin synthase